MGTDRCGKWETGSEEGGWIPACQGLRGSFISAEQAAALVAVGQVGFPPVAGGRLFPVELFRAKP